MGSTGSLLGHSATGHSAKDNHTHWVLGPLCFSCFSKVCVPNAHPFLWGNLPRGLTVGIGSVETKCRACPGVTKDEWSCFQDWQYVWSYC